MAVALSLSQRVTPSSPLLKESRHSPINRSLATVLIQRIHMAKKQRNLTDDLLLAYRTVRVKTNGVSRFIVPSETQSKKQYEVVVWNPTDLYCDCPQSMNRRTTCKHIRVVELI